MPGKRRTGYVEVERHIAVNPGAVPRFLIHPFVDGNSRVARLMPYAMLQSAFDTRGFWSVAHGLARQEQAYKNHLAACEYPRRGDIAALLPL